MSTLRFTGLWDEGATAYFEGSREEPRGENEWYELVEAFGPYGMKTCEDVECEVAMSGFSGDASDVLLETREGVGEGDCVIVVGDAVAEGPGACLGLDGLAHVLEVNACNLVGVYDGLLVDWTERVGMRVVAVEVGGSERTLWMKVDTGRAGLVRFDVDIVEGFASWRVHDLLLSLLGGTEALSGTNHNGGGGRMGGGRRS